jgi:preprotein translocase SecF subunit
MFNIVQQRKYFFGLSAIIIVAGIIAMVISVATYREHTPVRLGNDFLGGSLIEFQFAPLDASKPITPITEADIDATLRAQGVNDVLVQRLGDVEKLRWQARTEALENEKTRVILAALNTAAQAKNLKLDETQNSVNTVTPQVGREVTQAAVIAILVASLAVLGFIMFAFRAVENAFRYGACAVLAMLHDVLVVVGIMSIMGLVFKWEVDSLFLTALLTVVGYSVQDTIVVFDRIRENSARHRNEPYEMILNRSVLETLPRSLIIESSLALVMLALLFAGGESTQKFVAILLIGLLSGTYSSTFTAVPLMIAWQKGQIPFISRKAKTA